MTEDFYFVVRGGDYDVHIWVFGKGGLRSGRDEGGRCCVVEMDLRDSEGDKIVALTLERVF